MKKSRRDEAAGLVVDWLYFPLRMSQQIVEDFVVHKTHKNAVQTCENKKRNSLSSRRRRCAETVQSRLNVCVCGCSLCGVYIVDSIRSVGPFHLGGLIMLVAPLRRP